MHGIIYLASSIDGFIAGPNDDLSWLHDLPPVEKAYYDFEAFMAEVDCVFMGRRTFEVVDAMGLWPYTKPVYVFSATLSGLGKKYEGKAEVVSGDVGTIFAAFSKKGYDKIYIDGARTIQECLKRGLVDEMILTTVSKLLGSGTRLFIDTVVNDGFIVDYSMKLNGQMVMTRYVRKV